jgi:hypothetical protein
MAGLLDPPALTKQQGDARYPSYHDSIFNRLPIVASRPNGFSVNSVNLSDGTNTSANFRTGHVFTTDCTDLRFVFGNHYNGDTLGPNQITVKLGVEVPFVSAVGNGGQVGAILRTYFRGSLSATLDPGGFAITEPLPVVAKAGQRVYLHTNVSVATVGQKWPLDLYTLGSNWEGATKGAPAADLSLTSGIAQTTEPAYSPIAILGTPIGGNRPIVVALVGDSIGYGSGDSVNSVGFLVRAMNSAGIAYMQTCKPGEKAFDRNTSGFTYPSPRMSESIACTHAIEEYGRNDWANARTLAQTQADKLMIAAAYANRGVKVWATTQVPGTSSTDSWATTTNQTPTAYESVRLALNTWIRAGLPIDPSTKAAVAVGTAGALTAGQTGHPYVGYFEVADTVETARNSGLWKVTGSSFGFTIDGTHPSPTGHAAMAAAIDTTKLV